MYDYTPFAPGDPENTVTTSPDHVQVEVMRVEVKYRVVLTDTCWQVWRLMDTDGGTWFSGGGEWELFDEVPFYLIEATYTPAQALAIFLDNFNVVEVTPVATTPTAS